MYLFRIVLFHFLLALMPMADNCDTHPDTVTSLPGFNGSCATWPFRVYSGILEVPGPVYGAQNWVYDGLLIHYQFHTSQRSATFDPVVAWHNGGPGASSIYGLYTEMGYFQFSSQGPYINEFAWNRAANMLYLESPAGSSWYNFSSSNNFTILGLSQCLQSGKAVDCHWSDDTQAVAYAQTLIQFYKIHPEYASKDLYLMGESYYGQFGPNIARTILDTESFRNVLNLKGLAVGNGCWGGWPECNGPNGFGLQLEMYYQHALLPKHMYNAVHSSCTFPMPFGMPGFECYSCHITGRKIPSFLDLFAGPALWMLICVFVLVPLAVLSATVPTCCRAGKPRIRMFRVFGAVMIFSAVVLAIATVATTPACSWYCGCLVPGTNCYSAANDVLGTVAHVDPYDIINNCPDTWEAVMHRHGLHTANHVRVAAMGGRSPSSTDDGGYHWMCGGDNVAELWISRPDVRKALHIDSVEAGMSSFSYSDSESPSKYIYPDLIGRIRLLIYFGDTDPCVPVTGGEGWVEEFAAKGIIEERAAWHPWLAHGGGRPVSHGGYITEYVGSGTNMDFLFATVAQAGHMVPRFAPRPALSLFESFLLGNSSATQPVRALVPNSVAL